MLGPITRFGSSKGMGTVPNLSGLTRSAAIASIEAAGFKFTNSPIIETPNQSLNNQVASQAIPANTLLDYESNIDFSYYVYVAPAIVYTYGACEIYQSDILSSSGCVAGTCTYITNYTDYYRRIRYANGAFDGYEFCYTSPSNISTLNSPTCCPPPAQVCTPGESVEIPWGGCSGNIQVRYIRKTFSDCSSRLILEERCCRASDSCQAWADVPWIPYSGGEYKTRTCTDTRCNTYTETRYRCTATSRTTCGTCRRVKGRGSQTCTTTTTNSDCTTSSSSFAQSC